MADDQINKQEFLIRNLPTSQVTLYPSKAQVVRDINNVTLHPGANEITVYGITPTAEESSIKVEGRGSATITDMMVDLVTNKQAYEDVYPETDDEEEPPAPDTKEPIVSNEEIDALTHEIDDMDQKMKQLSEDLGSASGQLSILDKYKNTVEKNPPTDLPKFVQVYSEERQKAFKFFNESQSQKDSKLKVRQELVEKRANATHALKLQTLKADKEKEREAEKKARAQKEKADAKRLLKEKRAQFWPKKVYRIIISLEACVDTPMSSRRGSLESLSTLKNETSPADPSEISLSVSYVTTAASWAPRYDLSLHTSTATGTIIYRSEYYNATSETWKDAKISLSTSEAAFQGLGRPIPLMTPWHVKLASGAYNVSNALMSGQEHNHRIDAHAGEQAKASEPRSSLFGLPTIGTAFGNTAHSDESQSMQPQQVPQVQQVQHGHGHGLHQMQALNADRRYRTTPAPPAPPAPSQQYDAMMMHRPERSRMGFSKKERSAPGGSSGGAFEGESLDTIDALPDLPSLATEEATWAEEGLTFTYDVGTRTITPSFTKRRYRIVSVQVKNIHLSYLLVPKLQAAAFLKARIPNASSISLLRGMAGITLDGSFLGNTTIPRCSSGDSFSLSLGIDPSVNVTYGKPVMRRMKEGGLFFSQKDQSATFTRTCTIMNTKPKKAIEGLYLDQVPVSDDERLKVTILQPTDVNGEGHSTPDGQGITKDGRKEPKSGNKARVTRKAKGELCWDFRIEASRGTKFVLEYETKFPGGESVIEA